MPFDDGSAGCADAAELRAARRCSDCALLEPKTELHYESVVPEEVGLRCEIGRWEWAQYADDVDDLRSLLRTAASCDDYEEVRESEEGVGE